MDTCPQGIGSKIGDFHKGQPTAGRQELPGHCHLELNWNMPTRHKGCVCNHSIAPSQGFCFQLQGLCSGRGTRLKVPFIVPPPPLPVTLFLAVPCLLHASVEKVSLPRVSLLQMRRFTISHPRPVGSEVELEPKAVSDFPSWPHTKASKDFLSHEVSVVSHPLKQSSVETL